jgi:hypothetical protein
MRVFIVSTLLFSFSLFALSAFAQTNEAALASNAPKDKLVPIYANQLKQMDSVLGPYIIQAKATYLKAKERFIKGLPRNEAFFVVTRLFDKDGKFEQVFIRVKEFKEGGVSGTIANELGTVKEYKNNQLVSFKETQILDWVISKPDGSEEGNFIGKYLDTQ